MRVAALSFALLSSLVSVFSANSAQPDLKVKEFVIINDDGYGTSDCLARGTACGKIVADAWCEAKGYSKSIAYRVAEATDITNSTGNIMADSRAPHSDAFVISCTE